MGPPGKRDGAERKVQLADDRVTKPLAACDVVDVNFVRDPAAAGGVAAHRKLADEVGEGPVVRVMACLGAQHGDSGVAGSFPTVEVGLFTIRV